MEREYKYMVVTKCLTFNHAPYIEETLNGFMIQQTSFPCVYIVIDDASTDGEQDVLHRWAKQNLVLEDNDASHQHLDYGERYTACLKNNPQSFFVIILLSENHHGKKSKFPYISEWLENAKYQAFCEGDDYWIDPQKLEMQVQFMENHADYGMVHTDFELTKGWRNRVRKDDFQDGNCFPRIITEGILIGTLTVLFRNSVYEKIPKLYREHRWPMDDKPLWYEIAHESKIKYIPIVTAKYRLLDNSASHSRDINKMIAFKNAGVEVRLFYANYYGIALDSDGYGPDYYESIIRFACRLNEKSVAEDYYDKAKTKGVLTFKARLFYAAAKHPMLKTIINKVVMI